ncbi:MarR family winged helix-turn-helix transcriptional regulator [Streptomyces canus]|uniref:DNA-binding MarR family transcriptional regulator n=1 Tax=Streptomyces canus TaxID=58343 RepID=A0AAW8F4S4_9ACTN|nr:MarR family winged helix-turn-helix transcriptional regulator [Streptomyces canus]MDQ0767103.1 DNA-binding MarR family transcriptional regulator [Streptomyces canus]MDQ0904857.1 DNA-binding MarR family transcriptional regulator [Streptomyces canus]MDQ1065140.1 DNA-binding MarR family transcriptional regulator [Streptomyces canus]
MDEKSPQLSDTQTQAWRGLLQMNELLVSRTNRPIQNEFGLSEADCAVLTELTQDPEGWIRISDLVGNLGWEKSRLSHQLGRMAKRGLVVRKEYAADRRGAIIAATDKGRSAITVAAPRHTEEIRRLFFDHLSPRQIVLLMEITDRIIKVIHADTTAP